MANDFARICVLSGTTVVLAVIVLAAVLINPWIAFGLAPILVAIAAILLAIQGKSVKYGQGHDRGGP